MLPALGGSERRVYTAALPAWFPCNRFGWSPDGKSLVYSESVDDGTKARLTLLSLSDMATHALTFPSSKELDCDPVFSPDGSAIAFARGPRIEFFDFANGQSTPVFALDKPTSLYGGLALSPDGKSILFGQSELNGSYIMLMKNFR